MITVEQYIDYNSRPASEVTYTQARQMDDHIKEVTMTNLRDWLSEYLDDADVEFVAIIVRLHFGSAETNDFLKRHQLYPDYM